MNLVLTEASPPFADSPVIPLDRNLQIQAARFAATCLGGTSPVGRLRIGFTNHQTERISHFLEVLPKNPIINSEDPWSQSLVSGYNMVRSHTQAMIPICIERLDIDTSKQFLSKEIKQSLALMREDPTGIKLVEVYAQDVETRLHNRTEFSAEIAFRLQGISEAARLYRRLATYYIESNGLIDHVLTPEPSPN